MNDLRTVRHRLAVRKQAIDRDVPNHSYDSALALAAQAGGLQEAIDIIDETLATKRGPRGRVFKLDPKPTDRGPEKQ